MNDLKKLTEGMIRKGGVNLGPIPPRPAPPEAQTPASFKLPEFANDQDFIKWKRSQVEPNSSRAFGLFLQDILCYNDENQYQGSGQAVNDICLIVNKYFKKEATVAELRERWEKRNGVKLPYQTKWT